MVIVHRNNDLRGCGATTIASQSTVTAGGQPIAVVGDAESHGGGNFVENNRKVSIGGKSIIGLGDNATGDSAGHSASETKAASGISTVSIG